MRFKNPDSILKADLYNCIFYYSYTFFLTKTNVFNQNENYNKMNSILHALQSYNRFTETRK